MQVGFNKRGFTLIEVLVVMAISVILVGLILGPVVQSFRMTRQAQAMADAQDSARRAMELISRDLGEAMFVFDNAVMPVAVYDDGTTPSYPYNSGQEGPILLPVRQPNNSIEWFTLPYGKLDFILPKMSMHCNNPEHDEGKSRDYPRGNEAWPPCPVCGSSEVDARPKMPLEQDVTVVRYFLGLRYNDPTFDAATYGSDPPKGEGIFGWRSPYVGENPVGAENQVVLYRVEFNPHDDTLFPAGMPLDQRLSDPIFFYRLATNSAGAPCCRAWMDRARVVGMGKYQDLLVGTFAQNGNVTAVEPTVSFRFTAIDNDTFSATYSHDRNFDYPSIAPTVYRAAYGYWTGVEGITLYRYRDDQTDAYTTVYNPAGHLMIVKRSSDNNWTPSDEFDITQYLEDLENNDLATIAKPGSTPPVPPDVAFYFDYTTFPDPTNTTRKLIAFTPSRGVVHFSLIPPKISKGKRGPVMELDPILINDGFHSVYVNNRGGAMRTAPLNVPGGARIVPGSERIIGPNMTPGPFYGSVVLYERVPLQLGDPGLNQYKIDYDTGRVFFSSVFDQDLPVVPLDPKDPDGPPKPLTVDYRIQFNKKGDVVKGDYTTKAMVTVHLGMRMFDPDSAKAFPVDLTNSIKVRNALR